MGRAVAAVLLAAAQAGCGDNGPSRPDVLQTPLYTEPLGITVLVAKGLPRTLTAEGLEAAFVFRPPSASPPSLGHRPRPAMSVRYTKTDHGPDKRFRATVTIFHSGGSVHTGAVDQTVTNTSPVIDTEYVPTGDVLMVQWYADTQNREEFGFQISNATVTDVPDTAVGSLP